MNRTIKLLRNIRNEQGKRQLVELMPEDEILANDESILIAFYIKPDNKYVVIPDATISQVWEQWTSQF